MRRGKREEEDKGDSSIIKKIEEMSRKNGKREDKERKREENEKERR